MLGDIVQQAAISAGSKHVPTSEPRRGPSKDRTYFDDECRQLQAKFRYAAKHDPSSMQVLARRFSFTVHRMC